MFKTPDLNDIVYVRGVGENWYGPLLLVSKSYLQYGPLEEDVQVECTFVDTNGEVMTFTDPEYKIILQRPAVPESSFFD